ncbi:hypothetical protein GCM10010211_58620 [Streptomyces albospinus]|uniref:Uncharacterized protein n=1 Tax=Streptomyces albospinus TaxID=285515 RepID=A0ABQ2VFU2_9ACTN|nr:hypothetical protein GCM10010211_58620 [Streptomyces albospinus]
MGGPIGRRAFARPDSGEVDPRPGAAGFEECGNAVCHVEGTTSDAESDEGAEVCFVARALVGSAIR